MYMRTYNHAVQLDWDEDKRAENLRKHGVDFVEAAVVFDDPMGITIEDRDHNEQRFATVGSDATGRVLVVVYSYNGTDVIRIISARPADAGERKQYENIR
jgi:uncharacterized DUF497 family protein